METEYICAMREHLDILAEEFAQLHALSQLPNGWTPLIQRAAERNLQLLSEACVGIAKQKLKALNTVIPSDARQAFAKLQASGHDASGIAWGKVIGLRNVLVHDYLNLDAGIVKNIIQQRQYLQLIEFAHVQLNQKLPG